MLNIYSNLQKYAETH